MDFKIVLTLLDGEKISVTENSFLTFIDNDDESVESHNVFTSKIIYQDYLLNEHSSVVSAQSSSPLVGLMGLISSSEFFFVSNSLSESDSIDSSDIVVYKTSSIKSLSFK